MPSNITRSCRFHNAWPIILLLGTLGGCAHPLSHEALADVAFQIVRAEAAKTFESAVGGEQASKFQEETTQFGVCHDVPSVKQVALQNFSKAGYDILALRITAAKAPPDYSLYLGKTVEGQVAAIAFYFMISKAATECRYKLGILAGSNGSYPVVGEALLVLDRIKATLGIVPRLPADFSR